MSKRVKNVLVACIIVSIVIFLGTRYWENDYMEEAVNDVDGQKIIFFENFWSISSVAYGKDQTKAVVVLIIGDNTYQAIVNRDDLPENISKYNINKVLWDVFAVKKYGDVEKFGK